MKGWNNADILLDPTEHEAITGVPVKIGKALRAADLAGARRVVLVGPDEWAEGRIRVKDLRSGDETERALDELD